PVYLVNFSDHQVYHLFLDPETNLQFEIQILASQGRKDGWRRTNQAVLQTEEKGASQKISPTIWQ
ncbi:hypothetical protein, partial [Klebsiella pneumoniae]|uniref:hypothetical protein n=1 Tax=Klebsiella pneumoniae TaxID=573 RepID=UPI0024DE5419